VRAGHPAAVRTDHVSQDSEVVIQPRETEPGLTEQPGGNQPLTVLPGRPCPEPGALPLAAGRSPAQQPGCECAWLRLALLAQLDILQYGKCCQLSRFLLCPSLLCPCWSSYPCTSGLFASCGQSFSPRALWELVPSSHMLGLH